MWRASWRTSWTSVRRAREARIRWRLRACAPWLSVHAGGDAIPSVSRTRQGERKGRAVPCTTLHGNLAGVRGDDLPHYVESQPCAFRFGRIEWLENVW